MVPLGALTLTVQVGGNVTGLTNVASVWSPIPAFRSLKILPSISILSLFLQNRSSILITLLIYPVVFAASFNSSSTELDQSTVRLEQVETHRLAEWVEDVSDPMTAVVGRAPAV